MTSTVVHFLSPVAYISLYVNENIDYAVYVVNSEFALFLCTLYTATEVQELSYSPIFKTAMNHCS